ncbi:hypothetical protein GCM10023350_37650 [Nocardioides endophyticus]|uniref:DUF559 domain-containing protein n=1 Tax=Nocardioides endophyticus TaxID=1353775 RepID=A0ABP8Z7P6_9ACTN
MHTIPSQLQHGPFTRADAARAGVTSRMLQGRRFVRLHHCVWRVTSYNMTEDDWITAARLALPPAAHLTGLTRLQQLGLDFGPRRPIRFVVQGDLHLDLDGVFLHRTRQLAPTDEVGVTVAAAYLSYCAHARVIDAIKVGDWLLHGGHTTVDEIHALALSGLWRHGADEALWILEHLDVRSRSLMESELRPILTFAGLPKPEVNVAVPVGEDITLIGDLVYRAWLTVVEYEGSHHQEDRLQYNADLDRYALFRSADQQYVQVTKERIARPKILVGEVYRTLLKGGYDGPPPTFETQWQLLFRSVSVAVGPRRDRIRRSAPRGAVS